MFDLDININEEICEMYICSELLMLHFSYEIADSYFINCILE